MEINKSKSIKIMMYLILLVIIFIVAVIVIDPSGLTNANETISSVTLPLVSFIIACSALLLLHASMTNHEMTLRLEEHLLSYENPVQDIDCDNIELETSEVIIDFQESINLSDKTSRLPKVLISSELLKQLAEGLGHFRRQNHDLETGYALVGKVEGQGAKRKILINGMIEPGEQLDCSFSHVKHDRDNDQRELELYQLIDPHLCHMGDAHLHPGKMDVCSDGDYQTDLGNVKASTTGEMIFVIATGQSNRLQSRSAQSLYLNGLKLDFFYLGKSSNFQYQKVVPEVVDMPIMHIMSELRLFAEIDPVRARLDFSNLHRLPNYEVRITQKINDNCKQNICVELAHRKGFKVLIFFSNDPDAKPQVEFEFCGDTLPYKPDYLKGKWAPQVWFSQIALDAEKRILSAMMKPRDTKKEMANTAQRASLMSLQHETECSKLSKKKKSLIKSNTHKKKGDSNHG